MMYRVRTLVALFTFVGVTLAGSTAGAAPAEVSGTSDTEFGVPFDLPPAGDDPAVEAPQGSDRTAVSATGCVSTASAGLSACIEAGSPDLARDAQMLAGLSTRDAGPIPQWCIDWMTDHETWGGRRTEACRFVRWTVTITRWNDGVPTLVGGFDLHVVEHLKTAVNTSLWRYDITFRRVSASAWGEGLGLGWMLDLGAAACYPNCTVAHDGSMSTSLDNDVQPTGEYSLNGVVGTGESKRMFLDIPFMIGRADLTPASGTSYSESVRCDRNMPAGTAAVGCVNDWVMAHHKYSISGQYPDLALHIARAQYSGLPQVLTRLGDQALIDQNRRAACPARYQRPAGKQCDEYPFASSWQGAAAMPGAGPRTWPDCSINLGRDNSTGPTGHSVCMIDEVDNRDGGNNLGQFLRQNRVQHNENYRVSVTE